MDEHELRNLLAHVKAGRLSRRAWLRMMIGLGLTAPMAARMLIHMNDLVVQNVVVIPLFRWNEVVAASTRLRGDRPIGLRRLSLERRLLAPAGLAHGKIDIDSVSRRT